MKRNRLLIVEDEAIVRLDIKEMLQGAGYEVCGEARNGEEAVELARKHRPDAIMMDVKMPVMNGVKAAGIIRSFSDAAVVLLTAYTHRELVEDAKRMNIAAYVVKPVTEERLVPAIEMALGQREQRLALKQEMARAAELLEEKKWIERAKGKLMHQWSISEEEAHGWLRKESMASRMPMSAVAEQIVGGG